MNLYYEMEVDNTFMMRRCFVEIVYSSWGFPPENICQFITKSRPENTLMDTHGDIELKVLS